jgi:hypothetical protein
MPASASRQIAAPGSNNTARRQRAFDQGLTGVRAFSTFAGRPRGPQVKEIAVKPLTAKIAGRRHYLGVVKPLSMISLVDAPCPPDRNAVLVCADGVECGRIEAGLALHISARLRRDGIVFAALINDRTDAITVFLGAVGERLRGPNPTIVSVDSSNGKGAYAVDLRVGQCTCPPGRHAMCKHQLAFGIGA